MAAPLDLVDAVLQQLRGSACAALFGDSWNVNTQAGVQKFYADWSDSVSYPYLVVGEVGENYEYMTLGNAQIPWLAHGQLSVTIYATDRYQARSLGYSVGAALNDAPLTWTGQLLMELRMIQAAFIPNPPSGAGVPTVFVRQIMFQYSTQGKL